MVSSGTRSQVLGKAQMKHIIGFTRRELDPVDLNLTSRPEMVAVNEMYRKV